MLRPDFVVAGDRPRPRAFRPAARVRPPARVGRDSIPISAELRAAFEDGPALPFLAQLGIDPLSLSTLLDEARESEVEAD